MERLEVSEATFSEIAVDNEKFRIDDEFFQKKYINAYRKVKSIKHTTLNEELECLTDFHSNGSYETIAQEFDLLDAPDYAYMVRTTDLEMQNYNDDVKYVTKSAYNFLSKSKVYGGEVLINKIGTPGKSYLMPKLNRPVSLGMNLFMLRLKQDSKLTEPYLWTFLNTELGKNIISRKINGTVPLTIDKEAVKSLYIPVISNDCQKKIGNIVLSSQNKLKEAKELYAQAQNILLEATDLKGFNSSKENKAIKNFKESFLTTGRLDAEYYQPKYEEIISKIKQGEYDFLGNLVSIKKSIEPGSDVYSDEGLPFLRVADYNKFGISKPEKKLSDNFCNDNKQLINSLKPKKETILFSKDGSVGTAYMLREDADFITSGAIVHLTVNNKKVLPQYLALALNSEATRQQAERDAGGSIILHWRKEEIEKVVIPIINNETQQEIAKLIEKSFSLRQESEQLLNKAKEKVEKEIMRQ